MARKPEASQEKGFYEAYAGFARNLRTWFIAYGIGAPVLFLSNKDAWARIASSGQGAQIAYLFLGGVAVQILAAIIYKTAMWYLYVSELDRHQAKGWRYRVSDWVSESYWLEMIFDVTTLVFFGIATFRTLQMFG
jgi:hypothetical protein